MISDFEYSRISFKIQNPYFSNQDTLCIYLFTESLKNLYYIYKIFCINILSYVKSLSKGKLPLIYLLSVYPFLKEP